jgi:beta-lactamase regulating signal transducer with metallopeptidase domain
MDAAFAVFEAFASHGAGALLAGIAYALPVAWIAWAVIRFLPRANAATRYGIWLAALAVTLALDPLPGHPWIAGSPAAASAGASIHPPALMPGAAVADRRASGGSVSGTAGATLTASQPAPASLITLSGDWAVALFLVWYLIASALVVRLIVGHLRLQRIKERASPLGPRHQSRLAAWMRASGASRVPHLLVSDDVETPVAIGLFHPAIVIPAGLVEYLTDTEFDQIGLHELAHVQRHDDWTNLLQKIAEALLFFSPAVYVIGRQLSVEREVACDDWVVAATGSARPYANCLTRLAELAASRPVTVLPSLGAVFTQKQIFTRIERLLDRTRNARPQIAKGAAWAASLGALAVLLSAAQMAPLVAETPTSVRPAALAASDAAPSRRTSATASSSGDRETDLRVRAAVRARHQRSGARATVAASRTVPSSARTLALARVQQVASAAVNDSSPSVAPDAIKTALQALANAPGEEERLAAVSTLAPAAGELRVRDALLHALSTIGDESVRLNIVAALAPFSQRPDVVQVFSKILQTGADEPVSLNIIAAIAPSAGMPQATESLSAVLNSSTDEAVSLNALAAVAPFADRPVVQRALIDLMRTGRSEALRLNAVAALVPQARAPFVHGALVDTLDTDLPSAERANIKAALGIAPAATEVANATADWPAHAATALSAKPYLPGAEVMVGDVAPTGTVRIDNVHGNIEVIGWDRAAGEVDAVVKGDPNAVRVYGYFDHGDLKVTSTPVDGKPDVAVNYVIHVPAGAHVIVTTVTGNISVRGITGAVDASSTEGNVEVNGAHGPVNASSTTGSVRATGLRADSTLTSVSGDVDAEFDQLDGAQRVEAASTSGDVTIVMPSDASAHITAETVSGVIDACPTNTVDRSTSGASVDTTTGGGSATVDLHAVSGTITITSPKKP